MTVGGKVGDAIVETVRLRSLDPVNHPIPACLANLNSVGYKVMQGAGAMLYRGKNSFLKLLKISSFKIEQYVYNLGSTYMVCPINNATRALKFSFFVGF